MAGTTFLHQAQAQITLVAELFPARLLYALIRVIGHSGERGSREPRSRVESPRQSRVAFVTALAKLIYQRLAEDLEETRQGLTIFSGEPSAFHERQFSLHSRPQSLTLRLSVVRWRRKTPLTSGCLSTFDVVEPCPHETSDFFHDVIDVYSSAGHHREGVEGLSKR